MEASLKGALLSGLVFPGAGQIALKHYKSGIVLVLAVIIGITVIIVKGYQIAMAALSDIMRDGSVIDMNTITEAANRAVTASDNMVINAALLLIVICWVFGTIDAYRIGREKAKLDH